MLKTRESDDKKVCHPPTGKLINSWSLLLFPFNFLLSYTIDPSFYFTTQGENIIIIVTSYNVPIQPPGLNLFSCWTLLVN